MSVEFIEYSAPLSRAWARMKGMLFRPFNLELWFVLGFTAWLARLWDNAGLGGSHWSRGEGRLDRDDAGLIFDGDFGDWGNGDFNWFGLGGLEAGIIALLILFGLVFAVALAWLSSRGEFMFLDNVVHRRAKVSQPWREFGGLADSLFLWRIGVQILGGILALAMVVPALLTIIPIVEGGAWRGLGIMAAVLLGFVGVLVGFAAALINFWTDQFVVPIMYKRRVTILEGWRQFLPLLRARPLPMVLFALFFLVLSIAVGLVVMVAGLVTCCVGWILLSIPYIGTVIMLPIYVTGRAFGPEFLAQFGDEYRLWEDGEDAGGGDEKAEVTDGEDQGP